MAAATTSSPKISPPGAEGLVARDDQAGAFVAAANQHEHQVRGLRVEWDVADLVDDPFSLPARKSSWPRCWIRAFLTLRWNHRPLSTASRLRAIPPARSHVEDASRVIVR